MKPLPLILCGSLTLMACGEPVPNGANTQTGALAGGLFGALAGALADDGDRTRGAVIGGIAGAAIGGGIGQALDQQQRDLERQLGNSDVQIVNTGSELIVTMPQDILFDTDSAVLRPALVSDLGALAANLQQYPDTTVDVIGHTDNTGDTGYNQDLSTRRAQAVTSVLLGQGVSPNRVRSFGRGESDPVATNLTPEGRQQNRRVEIIIRPVA